MYGTVSRLLYTNKADFTQKDTFTSEASVLVGVSPEANNRPILPAGIFSIEQGGWGKAIRIEAMGIVGSTSTPTFTFQVRLGTSTTWSASDTSILQSAAISTGTLTTAGAVTNQQWRLVGNIICRTPGMGTGNCTLTCDGYVESMGGFINPFKYNMAPSNGALATLTATIDGALTQYVGLSVTCSASSGSNLILVKRLQVFELN